VRKCHFPLRCNIAKGLKMLACGGRSRTLVSLVIAQKPAQ
jgi:hypothetical protein